jgi:L-threonylcarbamoyladenylate synthase
MAAIMKWEEGIGEAVRLLQAGEVIGLPTETVYGLAGDGLNPAALARIFEAKERPLFDPLILHASDEESARMLTLRPWPETASLLAAAFWPGPLTLVLKRQDIVPDLATAGLETVAVRVPGHPAARQLLRAFGGPLAAPSANRFGRISPTTAEAVLEELGDRISLILDAGPCPIGVESTVVGFAADGLPIIFRPGGVPLEEIERVAGRPAFAPPALDRHPLAPGQLAQHYAPTTRLTLADDSTWEGGQDVSHCGLLAFGDRIPPGDWHAVQQLSATADLREATANLFAALRTLDASAAEEIVAMPVPDVGLGRAIMDRLRRASNPSQA